MYKLLVGCDLCSHSGWRSELFFVFVFPLCTGLCEVVILSADNWVCIFVLFIVWMRHPAQSDANARSCIQVVSFVGVLTI